MERFDAHSQRGQGLLTRGGVSHGGSQGQGSDHLRVRGRCEKVDPQTQCPAGALSLDVSRPGVTLPVPCAAAFQGSPVWGSCNPRPRRRGRRTYLWGFLCRYGSHDRAVRDVVIASGQSPRVGSLLEDLVARFPHADRILDAGGVLARVGVGGQAGCGRRGVGLAVSGPRARRQRAPGEEKEHVLPQPLPIAHRVEGGARARKSGGPQTGSWPTEAVARVGQARQGS